MAGRTFRQTRPNVDRIETGIVDVNGNEERTAGTVQQENAGNVGTDSVNFEPENGAESETIYADQDGYPIEPTSIGEPTEDRPRRKRTRSDAGIKRGARQKRVAFSSQGNLEKLMLSAHMMAAAFLKTPELRIDEQESAMLSKATLDVMKAYGVPELSDKQLATAQMLMAIGTVYAPRAIIIYSRTHSKPKLVQPIPFPSGAGKAVQDAQPNVVQNPVQNQDGTKYPQVFYGASPTPPPSQVVVPPQQQQNTGAGYISSAAFAADTSAGLDTINAS